MVIVKLMGGLGNQLFQYALAWRLCLDGKRVLKMDRRYLLDPNYFRIRREYCLDLFGIQPADASLPDLSHFHGKVFREKDGCNFTPELLREECSLYLDGHWQSEKYFADAADDFRRELSFTQPLTASSQDLARAIRTTNSVCLNIRRTDYLTDAVLNVCDKDYYERGVSYLKERVRDARLFVFSDDVDWCRSNLSFDLPTVFVDGSFAGDRFSNYLQLMALCRHFVIPNSTFGWWAAWLATHPEKIVVAPATWMNHPMLDYGQIVPESWVKLENQPAVCTP